jgi:hypothetical protein
MTEKFPNLQKDMDILSRISKKPKEHQLDSTQTDLHQVYYYQNVKKTIQKF